METITTSTGHTFDIMSHFMLQLTQRNTFPHIDSKKSPAFAELFSRIFYIQFNFPTNSSAAAFAESLRDAISDAIEPLSPLAAASFSDE